MQEYSLTVATSETVISDPLTKADLSLQLESVSVDSAEASTRVRRVP